VQNLNMAMVQIGTTEAELGWHYLAWLNTFPPAGRPAGGSDGKLLICASSSAIRRRTRRRSKRWRSRCALAASIPRLTNGRWARVTTSPRALTCAGEWYFLIRAGNECTLFILVRGRAATLVRKARWPAIPSFSQILCLLMLLRRSGTLTFRMQARQGL
jgi:hypothetical protein